jgi:hypothetical protein
LRRARLLPCASLARLRAGCTSAPACRTRFTATATAAATRLDFVRQSASRTAEALELRFDPIDRVAIPLCSFPAVAELRQPLERRLEFFELQPADERPDVIRRLLLRGARLSLAGRRGRRLRALRDEPDGENRDDTDSGANQLHSHDLPPGGGSLQQVKRQKAQGKGQTRERRSSADTHRKYVRSTRECASLQT